jgi:putative membrane protein
VGIVAYTFFSLDALGDEIEEPFGLESNDLPLDACAGPSKSICANRWAKGPAAALVSVNYQLT